MTATKICPVHPGFWQSRTGEVMAGIQLRIGTDCPFGGKALLSELLLLQEHGFSTASILQIASLNGALVVGLDKQCGVIEKGKKADLLIWEKSPFVNYKNFLSSKIIIKDGVIQRLKQ